MSSRLATSGMLVALTLASTTVLSAAVVREWSPSMWNGERALSADSGGWRAVVSLERGRLVHFGPADSGENLLFAPARRDDPSGWGGHRVWFGPQSEWPSVWPPPAAWEQSSAETVAISGATGEIELVMPKTTDGWPQLVRTYAWTDEGLVCRVIQRGGTHAAQVIQIVQVPSTAIVRVQAKRDDPATPHGFAILRIGEKDQVARTFPWPAQIKREGENDLLIKPNGAVAKFAFAPQELRAQIGGYELGLDCGGDVGRVVGEIDDGFNTQVYVGREGVPFLELEQLSPRFATGGDGASAGIILNAKHISK